MHRNQLMQALSNYQSSYPEELIFKQQILDFIQQTPECFKRSWTPGHITASAWLLNHDGSQALLLHHAKLNAWFQLGGHCDGESDTLAVAIKEAQEESGIDSIVPVHSQIFDIDVHLIPANSKEAAHYHYDIRYLLQTTSNNEFKQNHESKELRWIGKNIDQLPTNSKSVTRMFEKWQKLTY